MSTAMLTLTACDFISLEGWLAELARKWIVCKEKESTARWIPRLFPSFIISKWFEKKQNLPFSQPWWPITPFFVPNSYTVPLPSLVFLERQRGREEEGNAWLVGTPEIIYPNTFNVPKKETAVAKGKRTMEGLWKGKHGETKAPTSWGRTPLGTWVTS